MRKTTFLIKVSALCVIVFFLSNGLYPLCEATSENDTEILTIELIGFNNVHTHTLIMKQEQAKELEQLLNSLQKRFLSVTSKKEALSVFTEILDELNQKNILPEHIDLEKMQQKILVRIKYAEVLDFLDKKAAKNPEDDDTNYFCLLASETTETKPVGLLEIGCSFLTYALFWTYFISGDAFGKIKSFFQTVTFSYEDLSVPFRAGLIAFGTRHLSPSPPNKLENYPADGWIWTYGLKGEKVWNGTPLFGTIRSVHSPLYNYYTYFVGAMGFIGIKLRQNNGKTFVLGSSLKTQIGSSPPPHFP
jgi:hypothetical protein